MAEPVPLDPGPYRGSYKLIGGRPSFDLANLVSYRSTPRAHDWFVPESNAARWATAAGLPTPRADEVGALRSLRELVARVFLAIADGTDPAAKNLAQLGALAETATHGRILGFADGKAEWSTPAHLSLATVLAVDAVAILTDATLLQRVSACPGCRWLFLDTTKNHHRTWCDPADCGNRDRQRRHRTRQHAEQVD